MSPSGPIIDRVEVTSFSRKGSKAGFVTCRKTCQNFAGTEANKGLVLIWPNAFSTQALG